MEKWAVKRILIIGSTYPNYSRKYTELTCTGGILQDSLKMVRLHPIPRRYLEEDRRFKAFQWIQAKITKHERDTRPETYRIDPESIELGDVIPHEKYDERGTYILNSPHLCRSVEELKDRQKADGTSMGIIKPKRIIDCKIEPRSGTERAEWAKKEKALLSQEVLFGEKPKTIDFPEAKFKVIWECDDNRCVGHDMAILQWGIHELYRKYRNHPERNQKVIQAMWSRLDQSERDVFLFLGNFHDIQYNFGLMDSFTIPRKVQMRLFKAT